MTTVTTAKLEANRRNAKKSTGPQTPEGKASSALNATRHGLTAKQVLTPGESAEDFEAFASELGASLAPVGELEALLVERVVFCAWRLRRVFRMEAAQAIFQAEHREEFSILHRGRSQQGAEGGDIAKRAEVLVTLSRYEAALERSMYRALHQLERTQAARNGEAVPVPEAIDIDVAVSEGPPAEP